MMGSSDSDSDDDNLVSEDAAMVRDLPRDQIEDIADELAHFHGIAEVEDAEQLEAGAGDHVGPDADGEAKPAVLSPEELADLSHVGDGGYISCDAEPFASMGFRSIGRITSWPENKPYEKRSHSCSCFLHGSCKSPARLTRKVDNKFLLVWLYSGVHEPYTTAARKSELRELHKKKFAELLEE